MLTRNVFVGIPLWNWVRSFALLFSTDFLLKETVEETDEMLVVRMQKGDDQAFSMLYERYFQKMYSFVLRRVSHAQIAEDLVSDIFLKAFTHRQRFVWKVSFSAWLYRIATNRVTDYYRAAKPTEELEEERHDRADGRPGTEQLAEWKGLGVQLETLLHKLSERERLAITLKYYSECTNEEIAETLQVTANNAGVILHRALTKCEQLADDRLKAYAE